MKRLFTPLFPVVLTLFFGLVISNPSAHAVELTLPAVETEPGAAFEIPVMVDAVENLAGVKLSLTYNNRLLTFQKAEKTKATTSLMHIVNDKKPGVLIIVMAGARGIKGKEFPLLRLSFEAKTPENLPQETKIEVKEIQMMSDQLKDLPTTTVIRPILIRTPEKTVEAEKSVDMAPEANDAAEKMVPTDSDPISEKTPESSNSEDTDLNSKISAEASDSRDLVPKLEKSTKNAETADSTSHCEKMPNTSELTDFAPKSDETSEKAD